MKILPTLEICKMKINELLEERMDFQRRGAPAGREEHAADKYFRELNNVLYNMGSDEPFGSTEYDDAAIEDFNGTPEEAVELVMDARYGR